MSWTNYHTHSYFCDGKFAPEEHVKEAVKQGLYAYGVSTHSPVPFDSSWNMKMEEVPRYVKEVRQAAEAYKNDIQVYLGMEVDYIPNIVGCSSDFIQKAELDYTVGSIHYVDQFPNGKPWEIDGPHQLFLDGLSTIFHNDIRAAVERYYELTRHMIQYDCPDVIGHLDKIKMQNEDGNLFSEDEGWYRDAVEETLEVIAQSSAIVEVNTRGLYKKATDTPYPSPWILEKILEKNIPICLNADSHIPTEITKGFSEAAHILKEIGFNQLHILYNGEWQGVDFDTKGLKMLNH
ncbi:histidinol-phosphatase [Algivirga pacifica]|uniref:Histidinol-phosphatase n=1 Tax=Algivirga pacifica TaxID=1162670 RepID=A0ABP9DDB1_9BACT